MTHAASIVQRIQYVSRMNPFGGPNAASRRKLMRRFSLVLSGNQKTPFAAKFWKHWTLPPKLLTKNRHYSHRAPAAMMVKFSSCKHPAHKSASVVDRKSVVSG